MNISTRKESYGDRKMSERAEFEKLFPVPDDVTWIGNGYVPTEYSADQGYDRMWQVWQAARSQGGRGAEPVAFIEDDELEALREGLHIVRVRLKDDRPDCTPLYAHPQSAVPEGWKLVPVEPTKEMRRAFHEAHELFEDGEEVDGSPDDEWRAMLAAAPQPPKEGE